MSTLKIALLNYSGEMAEAIKAGVMKFRFKNLGETRYNGPIEFEHEGKQYQVEGKFTCYDPDIDFEVTGKITEITSDQTDDQKSTGSEDQTSDQQEQSAQESENSVQADLMIKQRNELFKALNINDKGNHWYEYKDKNYRFKDLLAVLRTELGFQEETEE